MLFADLCAICSMMFVVRVAIVVPANLVMILATRNILTAPLISTTLVIVLTGAIVILMISNVIMVIILIMIMLMTMIST